MRNLSLYLMCLQSILCFYNSRRIYEDVIASQNNISEAIISTAKEDSISLMSIANMRPATIEVQSENDDKQISEKLLLSILSAVRRLEQSQVMQSRKLNVLLRLTITYLLDISICKMILIKQLAVKKLIKMS